MLKYNVDYKIAPLMPEMGGHSYLLYTDTTAVMIDSGYAFTAPKLIGMIKERLGERPLDYILLTHSHYDHCSGSVYCCDEWPDLKIVGGEYAQQVFTRESAKQVIREMNEVGRKMFGYPPIEDKTDQLRIDIPLKDGEDLQLGDIHIQVVYTPGHTKDSVSYFWPEAKLLFPSETSGTMPNPPMINPEYLVGYQMTLDSIDKLAALEAEVLYVPHRSYLTASKEGVAEFFRCSRYWAVETKDRIVAAHKAGATKQEMMEILREMYLVGEKAKGQPLDAFMLNASYTVPMLIRECCGEAVREG